jgi:Putative inner membrane protein (DUF1819)
MKTSVSTSLLREWRATGPYLPTSASKNGLVPETRLFLQAYGESRSVAQARTALIDRLLPQRSRATRALIARFIQARLTRWNPPEWVLEDLVDAGTSDDSGRLCSLLLLHHARQETLLYDTVQRLIVPRWQRGEIRVTRDDVLSFLSELGAQHEEAAPWSYETRVKIAGNTLTTLRDYALLTGTQVKQIVEPAVDDAAVRHLSRLLREEGVAETRLSDHADWRLWLMTSDRVRMRTAAIAQTDGDHGSA